MSDTFHIPIATVPKNSREDVRVALTEFKGTRFADVRVYAQFAGPDTSRSPTKQGVAVSFENLPKLAAALVEAERQARELGLIREPA